MIKTEQGYTLVELLIVLAITGIIFTVIGGAIHQLTAVSGYGNDSLTANHELQNVAYWFNTDGQCASTATGGSSLTLSLPDGQTIIYSLTNRELLRSSGFTSTALAQNISSVDFTMQDRLLSMHIISSPSGKSQVNIEQTYQVYLRPAQQ